MTNRFIVILLVSALLISCSGSSDIESRYEESVQSLSSFLDKHGEGGNNKAFRIVLDYLQATPVDVLGNNQIVYAGLNVERSVLVLYWVGDNPYIEGVRISNANESTRYWDVALDSDELGFQKQRSTEKVHSATVINLPDSVATGVREVFQSEVGGLSLSLLLEGQLASQKYSNLQLLKD